MNDEGSDMTEEFFTNAVAGFSVLPGLLEALGCQRDDVVSATIYNPRDTPPFVELHLQDGSAVIVALATDLSASKSIDVVAGLTLPEVEWSRIEIRPNEPIRIVASVYLSRYDWPNVVQFLREHAVP